MMAVSTSTSRMSDPPGGTGIVGSETSIQQGGQDGSQFTTIETPSIAGYIASIVLLCVAVSALFADRMRLAAVEGRLSDSSPSSDDRLSD
jgi:hypothetical protein